jgi:hypothetical protein
VYLCYIDESGTPEIPGNSGHYVLSGLAIPIDKWRIYEKEISEIKIRYGLEDSEIHTGWIIRKYLEQSKILNFDSLDRQQRKTEVKKIRNRDLLDLQKQKNPKKYKQTKKNYLQTDPYVHLTYENRKQLIREISELISSWKDSRLFAECIDKIHFDPSKSSKSVDEQAFEQIVSRFEQFLKNVSSANKKKVYGLMIHDNNQTVAKKHTELMKKFHASGTWWTGIENIIETPLFVDSALTSMVQLADVCSYSFRRYLDHKESELFKIIFSRADKKEGICVGVRHFSNNGCLCSICQSHKKNR